MPERDGYMQGVPCWLDTNQPDPEAAVDFYGGLFGWDFEDVMPAGQDGKYFMARIRGRDVAAVSSPPREMPPMAMWNTYIWVDSADETAEKVKEAGGKVMVEPFDVMDSGRMAVCADPEGAVFCLWEAKEHRGAAIVNEHGSVNFNTLSTRDLEGARAFYGSVFGWETLDLGPGNVMWRLAGYGDYLEKDDPGIRERLAEFGGPQGFEDVVAAVSEITDDEPDVPANWSITFGVDDVDETAARAAELGANVIAGPFDAPWVRMAIVADPQGARFVASQFVPENQEAGS